MIYFIGLSKEYAVSIISFKIFYIIKLQLKNIIVFFIKTISEIIHIAFTPKFSFRNSHKVQFFIIKKFLLHYYIINRRFIIISLMIIFENIFKKLFNIYGNNFHFFNHFKSKLKFNDRTKIFEVFFFKTRSRNFKIFRIISNRSKTVFISINQLIR
ncbi:hypothetical protein D3C86_1779150 [compost metagenome]